MSETLKFNREFCEIMNNYVLNASAHLFYLISSGNNKAVGHEFGNNLPTIGC